MGTLIFFVNHHLVSHSRPVPQRQTRVQLGQVQVGVDSAVTGSAILLIIITHKISNYGKLIHLLHSPCGWKG